MLEAARAISSDGELHELDTKDLRIQLARFDQTLTAKGLGQAERSSLLDGVEEAVLGATKLRQVSLNAYVGLEALVCLIGRPSVQIKNGDIDLSDPSLEEWRHRLVPYTYDGMLARRARSIGRIDLDGAHQGTGFVVGLHLVLTNRHVLQHIAVPVPRRERPTRWVLKPGVTIDFADNPDPAVAERRFPVIDVLGWGENEIIDGITSPSVVDLALLRVQCDGADTPFPPPLELRRDVRASERHRAVLAIGYPAPPQVLPTGPNGQFDIQVLERLRGLYPEYGRKYVSPGYVTRQSTGIDGQNDQWSFAYDATTLNGNSGSPVLGLEGNLGVCGVHCRGAWRTENLAHAIGRFTELPFLSSGDVTWQ